MITTSRFCGPWKSGFRFLLTIGVCSLASPGCSRDSEEPSPRAHRTDLVSFAPEQGAVLPLSEGQRLIDQCGRSTPRGVRSFWSPSDTVIAELEARLPQAIADSEVARKSHGWLSNGEYHRQYVGIVYWTGKRTIYTNSFSRSYLESLNRARRQVAAGADLPIPDTVRWRLVAIRVCDGGSLFWGVEYDHRSHTFGRVHANSSAG
jgi:hypothetical protein